MPERGLIQIGVGAADYKTERDMSIPKVLTPSGGSATLERHILRISQMIRDLRPGQTISVTYHGEGKVDVALTDAIGDPA